MPANPIFGGPIGSWGNYARQRGVQLNNNPNLSQAEYAARMASLGNPTNAQSYQNYMASDDYAAGWRPTTTTRTGGIPMGSWYPQSTTTTTPTNPADYLVPTQLGGVPNIIPVGANITDGTTTTTNNPTPTTPTSPTPTYPSWWPSTPFPTTGSAADITAWIQSFLQGMPGGSGAGGGTGGGGASSGNYSPYLPANNGYVGNPNNMSYSGGGYPQTGIQQSTRNPNNMSYNPVPGVQYPQTLGQTPTQNANPTVVQEWSNQRTGGNKKNRR